MKDIFVNRNKTYFGEFFLYFDSYNCYNYYEKRNYIKDNFIKGILYKEIYRNEMNSYMVGLFKVKETNIDDI